MLPQLHSLVTLTSFPLLFQFLLGFLSTLATASASPSPYPSTDAAILARLLQLTPHSMVDLAEDADEFDRAARNGLVTGFTAIFNENVVRPLLLLLLSSSSPPPLLLLSSSSFSA
ncbi:hypothetical protein BJX64DRAFT_295345 [Aspergillus heterothallicus]